MADRTVNGNLFTENGWRLVDTGSCVWVKVPGTNVSLQIREGQPAKLMGAFAADFNAYVEPLRDADSACYTESNSVLGTPGHNNGSNHMSATAMDLNWNSHPFQQLNAGFDAAKIATVREMLAFYEDTIFWGNDWNSPKDAMHFQMDYDTYGSEHVDRVQSVIDRKVRADGFSTFRRGGTVNPPPQTALSRADGYAVRIINEGNRRGVTPKGIQIALATGIVESNITVYANSKLPKSLALPHDAVGNDGYSVGIFQQQVKDTGNGWWWGDEATCMGVESSAGLFYDRLVKLPYNGTSKTPGAFAQQIQGSAFPARYDEHWGEAVALYNRLSGITAPPPQTPGDDMASVPQDQWDRVYRELTQKLPSRSPLRHLGEGAIDTLAGFVLNTDGSQHVEICKILAGYGHPPTLALLREVAAADPLRYPDRQDDAKMAQAILAGLTPAPVSSVAASAPAVTVDYSSQLTDAYAENARLRDENNQLRIAAAVSAAPQTITVSAAEVPALIEAAPVRANSTGQQIGTLFDALEGLRLADALPIEGRAPLAALIGVLNTKNGSQL